MKFGEGGFGGMLGGDGMKSYELEFIEMVK